MRPHWLFPSGHDAAIKNDFEPMKGHEAHRVSLRFNRTAAGAENDLIAGRATVGLERQERPRCHKSLSAAHRFGPARKAELFLTDIGIGAVCPGRHIGSHFVGATDGRKAIPAVEVSIPIEKAQIVEVRRRRHAAGAHWPDFKGIKLGQHHIGGNFASRVREVRRHSQPAVLPASVSPLGHAVP